MGVGTVPVASADTGAQTDRQDLAADIYPCTWAGLYDFSHGVKAYRHDHYTNAALLWKAAAFRNCAMAAYNLALMYFYGAHTPANEPLGTAWMSIAARSRYTKPKYVALHNTWLTDLGAGGRAQAHADYERLLDRYRYRVTPGETLSSIAQQHGVSIAALRAANVGRIPQDGDLQAGQILSIPQS